MGAIYYRHCKEAYIIMLFEMKVKGDVNQSYVEINIVILLRSQLFP